MTVTPTTVRAGGTITASSVDPCNPPANTPGGAPFVRVTVTRGRTSLGSGRAPTKADGSWTVPVHISSRAAGGSATVSAFCFFNEQAEGALEAYAPVTIRITRPGAGAATLARTGRNGLLPVGAAGIVLIGFGLMLVVAADER
jgi:hypothetical protein